MRFSGVRDFVRRGLGKTTGPVAVIFAEDEVEVASTAAHHAQLGFGLVAVIVPPEMPLAIEADRIVRIDGTPWRAGMVENAIARIASAAHGRWMYWGYNAEFLAYSYMKTRSVEDLLAFHQSERRQVMMACLVDVYPSRLADMTAPLDRTALYLDGAGYTSEVLEPDPEDGGRRVALYGGLRWRHSGHVPKDRRRIDRPALFRGRAGIALSEDRNLFGRPDSWAPAWHDGLTAAVWSFRAAKALARTAGARETIDRLDWPGSIRCDWTPAQLLQLGLMGPGQWV